MTWAYSFIWSDSSTDRLCARLNELGDWSWRVGDSHWYGDYVACVPFAGVRIRIIDFPERAEGGGYKYDSDIRIDKECKTPRPVIDEAYLRVLAAIGAYEVREIETFD